MRTLRIAIRLLLMGVHIIVGILLCIFALPSDWSKAGASRRRGIVRWWLRTCVRIIGIRLRVHGKPGEGAALIVANHVSWMDIVIVGGLQPVSFLSKAEIARWPIIGYLSRKGGTLFIDRGIGAETAARLIGEHLHAGASVAFFPEGTTSDGTAIQRFHPRLFAAAIDNNVPVQPVVITYPYEQAHTRVHPKAPYTRDIPFFRHALEIIAEPCIHAVVRYADRLSPGGNDRKQLAEKTRELMIAAQNKDR